MPKLFKKVSYDKVAIASSLSLLYANAPDAPSVDTHVLHDALKVTLPSSDLEYYNIGSKEEVTNKSLHNFIVWFGKVLSVLFPFSLVLILLT